MEKKTTQNGQKPSQLPVKGGSKAMALQVNEAKNRTSESFDTAADEWLDKNPAGAEFNEAEFGRKNLPIVPDPDVEASVETPPPVVPDADAPPPSDAPATETPAPDATPSSQPSSIPSAATATTAPADAATTPTAPATAPAATATPAQPAAAEPTRLAPDARFLIGDGTVPWTGHQITLALRERAEALPMADEAKAFRQYFGVDNVEKAKEAWTPMLDALRAHPERITFLEDALEHMAPDKFQYLVDSAAHYDTEAGAPSTQASAAQPSTQSQFAKVDPAFEARVKAIEEREAKFEAQRQWNHALTTFPVLGQRKELRDQLIATFNKMYQRDPSTTLYDALEIYKPMYEAVGIVNHQGNVAQAVAEAQPAAPTPPVPALNGSQGATPAGTRPAPDNAPRKFDDVEDAVDDWMTNNK